MPRRGTVSYAFFLCCAREDLLANFPGDPILPSTRLFPFSMYPKRTDEDAVVRGVDDELIIFKTRDNKMHHLNATAAFLWKMCDGTSSSEQMVDALESVFDAPRKVLMRDVASTLEELALRGLISMGRNRPSE